MKFLFSLLGISLAFGLMPLHVAAEDGFRRIFNGTDLTGWEGNPKVWSVRNGVIRGETSLSNLALSNTFLIWKGGELKDFELRVKFRIQNGNSGIQYRSRDLGKWVVAGYQAEVENNPGKVGFLYEEKGRKFLANVGERVLIDAKGARTIYGSFGSKDDFIGWHYYESRDWNEYWIIARGNYITHYLNGYQTIELIDEDPKARGEGVLALQIHAGPPMLVEFKDILLKKQ
jgi:hypothetical protein